jgi:hypothetical protein
MEVLALLFLIQPDQTEEKVILSTLAQCEVWAVEVGALPQPAAAADIMEMAAVVVVMVHFYTLMLAAAEGPVDIVEMAGVEEHIQVVDPLLVTPQQDQVEVDLEVVAEETEDMVAPVVG